MKKTLNQNRNQWLNISKWVAQNRHKISEVEIKAYDMMREDMITQSRKSEAQFMDDCLIELRKWELYKRYRSEHPYYQGKHEGYLKELSKINVKMLVLIHNYKDMRIDYILKNLREKKSEIKTKIKKIYS